MPTKDELRDELERTEEKNQLLQDKVSELAQLAVSLQNRVSQTRRDMGNEVEVTQNKLNNIDEQIAELEEDG